MIEAIPAVLMGIILIYWMPDWRRPEQYRQRHSHERGQPQHEKHHVGVNAIHPTCEQAVWRGSNGYRGVRRAVHV